MNEPTKQLAAIAQDLPLDHVAQQLGLTQDKHDSPKWTGNGHTISLYNHNHIFSDWATDVTGQYGAINLVMHVQGSHYKEALAWLAEIQNQPLPPVTPQPEKRFPSCNMRDESQWPAVQQYLVHQRRLPLEFVTALHEQGAIAADSRQNVMFFRHELVESFQCGQAIGATLRGTIPDAEGGFFKGLTPETRREDGFFWIQQGEGTINRVVLTEAPIDAISLAALDNWKESGSTIYLSTDGRGAIPVTAIQQVIEQGGELILAQDNAQDGNRQAWSIAQQFPDLALMHLQPDGSKDRNDYLRGIPHTSWNGQAESDGLWNWYQVAEPQDRLHVAQIATEFLAPNSTRSLTEPQLAAIAQATELLHHSQQVEAAATGEGPRESELARASEILNIADCAYAFGAQIGHLQFDGEFWTVCGKNYDISYNLTNDNFFVVGKGESQMPAQRVGPELDPASTGDVRHADLVAFRETETALTRLKTPMHQTPAQTVAIAQQKLEETHQITPSSLAWGQTTQTADSQGPETLGKPLPQPTLSEVRLWYVQARDLGLSERHSHRIEDIGKSLAQAGSPLSKKALRAMAQDQTQWIAQVEAVVEQARTILALKGEPMAGGTFYAGQQCCLFERDGLLVATSPDRGAQPTAQDREQLPGEMLARNQGLILKVENNTIDCQATRITNRDAERFQQFSRQVQSAVNRVAQVAYD